MVDMPQVSLLLVHDAKDQRNALTCAEKRDWHGEERFVAGP